MNKKFVVAGIHTDAGKTFVSGVLCRGLGYRYWKPVQTGSAIGTDRFWMENIAGLFPDYILPEQYCFKLPASPHLAAKAEGTVIDPHLITVPDSHDGLIIELAGGLMVPINDDVLMIDLVKQWNLPVILVVPLYLGSINHALLSLEALHHRNILVAGIVFNNGEQPDGSKIIASRTLAPIIGSLPFVGSDSKTICNAFHQYLMEGWIQAGLPYDGPAAS